MPPRPAPYHPKVHPVDAQDAYERTQRRCRVSVTQAIRIIENNIYNCIQRREFETVYGDLRSRIPEEKQAGDRVIEYFLKRKYVAYWTKDGILIVISWDKRPKEKTVNMCPLL